MSVLLTAAKTKSKPKLQKKLPRQDSSSSNGSNSGVKPPLSNENTAVWYWDSENSATTIMLSRDSMQLWCNGVVVEADDLITDGDFEFEIFHKLTEKCSTAHIMAVPDMHGVMTFNLYVDGNFIPEHTAASQYTMAH